MRSKTASPGTDLREDGIYGLGAVGDQQHVVTSGELLPIVAERILEPRLATHARHRRHAVILVAPELTVTDRNEAPRQRAGAIELVVETGPVAIPGMGVALDEKIDVFADRVVPLNRDEILVALIE